MRIVVAGSTGALGSEIVKSLRALGANVRALVRHETDINKVTTLRSLGVEVMPVDFANEHELRTACSDSSCVISALSGLRNVIVDTQKRLLDAAINAQVTRFIPSDFSIDFTKTISGGNRNLDLRREFKSYLDQAPIAATSIFNGAFTNLLVGDAPIILFKFKKILYWQDPDQKMDFTTISNTAEFTAHVALASTAPRSLHIAGDVVSPRDLAEILSSITGEKFQTFRAGSLKLLSSIISLTRFLNPAPNTLYPAWQGMQYMRDMAGGLARPDSLDNNLYPDIKWQGIAEFLSKYKFIKEPTVQPNNY